MSSIGIVGIENSHATHIVDYLDKTDRFPGHRVTALVAGEAARTAELREAGAGHITHVVERPEDLVGKVDAVVVSSRDGALHRRQAEPLLAAGIPVLVDKPLATSVGDAEALVACAERHGTPLMSASALRTVPEIRAFGAGEPVTEGAADLGTLLGVHIIGTGSPASPYSGLWFYGIHHVEAALELCSLATGGARPPGPLGEVAVNVVRHLVTATTTVGGIAVTLSFVDDAVGHTDWAATLVGSDAVVQTPLTLGPDYAEPVLARFLTMVETGRQPYPADEMVQPIRLLSSIEQARTRRAAPGQEQ